MATKTSKRQKTYELALYAMLTALIIVMTFTPVGYITTPTLSVTLIHLPVIIAAVTLGPKGGTLTGAVWGITCLIKAFVAPPSPIDGLLFRNPLVSVFPRVLAGFAAGVIFWAISKSGRNTKAALGSGLAALGGALTNTVVTLSLIYILYHDALEIQGVSVGGLGRWMWAIAGVNAPIEIAAAVVLAVPVSVAVRRVMAKQRT
ncbi:MAG: ECF transporter S component [Oscillospiraceae bacterium]|nr:ECF transporter S component [Oscillospiraceae bacterium]